LDLSVIHWTGGIAKLDSSVLSWKVVCYVGQKYAKLDSSVLS